MATISIILALSLFGCTVTIHEAPETDAGVAVAPEDSGLAPLPAVGRMAERTDIDATLPPLSIEDDAGRTTVDASEEATEPDVDAGNELDAGTDAGEPDYIEDAALDAGEDAGQDAAPDIPDCECTEGVCCDGCHFYGTDKLCQPGTGHNEYCDKAACGTYFTEETQNRWCNGDRADCVGAFKWSVTGTRECSSGKYCGTSYASRSCLSKSACD